MGERSQCWGAVPCPPLSHRHSPCSLHMYHLWETTQVSSRWPQAQAQGAFPFPPFSATSEENFGNLSFLGCLHLPSASCSLEAGAQRWHQVSQLHSSVTQAGHRTPQHLAGFVATGLQVLPEPMATPVAWLEAASLSTLPHSSPNLLHFLGERCPLSLPAKFHLHEDLLCCLLHLFRR